MEEKLANLTFSQAATIGVVVAVFYYFSFYDNGETVEQQINSAKQNITTETKEIERIDKALSDAARFQVVAEQLGAEMQKIQGYIPKDLTSTSVMKLVSEEAKVAGTNIENLSAGRPTTTDYDFIEEISVSVNLSGTYAQHLSFLSFLTASGKIIKVSELTMSGVADTDIDGAKIIRLNASLKAFKYVEKGGS